MIKATLIAILLTSAQGVFAADKPLKVFILAGQSNMQGKGQVSTFDYIGMDPKTAPMLKEMRNPDGTPVVCEDVWISELGSGLVASEERHGKLSAEYGSANKGPQIGPEYTFGLYLRKHLNEPFLIIKTAWGGRSLNTDFRPPSAGPFPLPEGTTEEQKKAKEQATGDAYRMMMNHVKKVLADPARVCPAYNPAAGYEIAGFVWFQGWNDLVDRRVYPDSDFSAYSELLAHFIRDARRDLNAPKMPFVVGVLGVGGKKDADHPFRKAMAAPAGMPEFKGNVFNVFTADYWDDELDELFNRAWRAKEAKYDPEGRYAKLRPALLEHEKQQANAKDLSKNERREMAQKRLDILYTPEEQLKMKGASNKPYHYLGAAKIYGQIGKAFAETMAEAMLKIGVPEEAQPTAEKPNGESKLPRVLLLGDSISGGYVGPVSSLLKGKAWVQRGNNGGPTTTGLQNLDQTLGDEPWDLIHFNWGLHDMTWQFRMAPEERGIDPYAARLEQLVLRLKKTGAKLIWATTTPWCPETYSYVEQRYKRKLQFSAEEEKQWKDAALEVMKKHDIPVNDLHALLLPDLNEYLNKPDDIHFNRKGSEAMARQIAAVIGVEQLKQDLRKD